MKKKLLALMLCMIIAAGILPAAVMAEEGDSRNPVVQFTIVKKVEKSETAATPPAETFEFVLDDTANEKKSLSEYGITLLDELKIATDGVNDYSKIIRAKIDMAKVNPNGGWESTIPVGSQSPSSYYKTFHITEKNDSKDGWEYSTARYAVTFKYDCDSGNMTCGVYEVGNDVSFRAAEFTNTYTKKSTAPKTIEIPFTVTVKQGGNVAPGKQTFELEIFMIGNSNTNEYKDVTCTASVETNGVGDYNGKLVITGPADQVEAFTCEGFFIREKDTKVANWEYSDAVWYVTPILNDGYDICPAELKTSDNGDYYDPDRENTAEKMTFVNTYTENKTVEPPKTGDSGTLLLIAMLVICCGTAAGTAAYSRKRKA